MLIVNDGYDHFDDHRQRYDNHHFPVGTQRILQPTTTKLCLLRRRIYPPLWESRNLKGICQGITLNISRPILTHNTFMLVLSAFVSGFEKHSITPILVYYGHVEGHKTSLHVVIPPPPPPPPPPQKNTITTIRNQLNITLRIFLSIIIIIIVIAIIMIVDHHNHHDHDQGPA